MLVQGGLLNISDLLAVGREADSKHLMSQGWDKFSFYLICMFLALYVTGSSSA